MLVNRAVSHLRARWYRLHQNVSFAAWTGFTQGKCRLLKRFNYCEVSLTHSRYGGIVIPGTLVGAVIKSGYQLHTTKALTTT